MEKRLPDGWEIVKLGDYSTIFNGKTPSKNQQRKKGHPILKIKDINENGCFIGKFDSFVDAEFFEKNKAKCLKDGDTLILNAAHNSEYVGSKKAYISEFQDNVIPTGEWLIIRSDSELLDSRFKHFLLTSNLFKVVIKSIVKGIHLYPNDMKTLKIPLPPIETQRKIVAILEKAEATKNLRMQADELANQLLQSVFLEMFGDPAKNPKGWETEKLGVNCSFITSGSRGWAKFYSLEGAKFIRVQNLTRHRLSFDDIAFVSPPATAEAKRTKVKPDDLLISITGVVGLVAVAPADIGDAYVSQHVAIVRLRERTDPSFLASFLAHPTGGQFQIMNRQYGQTKPGIGLDDIRSIRIFIPPISLQQKFAQIVEKVEAMRQNQKQSQQEIDNLFNALMQKAFKGELVA